MPNDASTNLDLLRALAVVAVFVSHVPFFATRSPTMHSLGVGGVLFFFVHTSLVLLQSLDRQPPGTPWRAFYLRRAFRIYPLAWVCILFVAATGLTDVPATARLGAVDYAANLALVQNLTGHPDALGTLWSLPWEVQMYLALPLLHGLTRRIPGPRVPLLLWAVPLALFLAVSDHLDVRQAYLVITPLLFMGGLLAHTRAAPPRRRWPAGLWPVALLLLMLLRLALLDADTFTTPRNVVVNATCGLALGASIPYFRDLSFAPLTRLSHLCAKYSYGIYLFHLPMLRLAFLPALAAPFALRLAGAVAATLLLSVLAFHALEQRAIDAGKRVAARLWPPTGVSTARRSIPPAPNT